MLTNDQLNENPEVEINNPDFNSQTVKEESLNTTDEKPNEAELLKIELEEQKDKYLRLFAEFDNYKKRTLKEKIELTRNASQDLIQDLLVILDDFDRAKKLSEDQGKPDIFPEGMRLVHHKLLGILQTRGLESKESDGQVFDPQYHEAITEVPVEDPSKKGKVIDTIEKAYVLNHKMIRFAKVIVGK